MNITEIKRDTLKVLVSIEGAVVTRAEYALKYADTLRDTRGEGFKAICGVIAERYQVKVKEGQRGWTFDGPDLKVGAARQALSWLKTGALKTGALNKGNAKSKDLVATARKALEALSTSQLRALLKEYNARF